MRSALNKLDRFHVKGVPEGPWVKAADVSALEDERDRLYAALDSLLAHHAVRDYPSDTMEDCRQMARAALAGARGEEATR